jgi:hypothetical protein
MILYSQQIGQGQAQKRTTREDTWCHNAILVGRVQEE